jgi:hypothetical protein
LDTTTASAPQSAAAAASPVHITPLMINCPGQRERSHSMSFQVTPGSNWDSTKAL